MTSTRKQARTAGARALAQLTKKYGAAAVARKLKVGPRQVAMVASGERLPSLKLAATIEAVYGIAASSAWSASVPEAKAAPAPMRREAEAVGDTLEEVEQLVGRLKADVSALSVDATASARDRAQAASALGQALRDLSRLRGEEEISEARIAKSPAWARLSVALVDAAKDCPSCLVKLVRVCERLDGEAQAGRGET